MLPKLSNEEIELKKSLNRLLLIAEGFEPRSVFWISRLVEEEFFTDALIFTYLPIKKSRLDEMHKLVELRTKNRPDVLNYKRFEPYEFENSLLEKRMKFSSYDEIIIDISVMSKLMIMIVINVLQKYQGSLKIVYSLPKDYAPSSIEYESFKNSLSKSTELRASYGVHDVVRTPQLTSIIMQRSPSLLISFLSFNEQLIKSLLPYLNPTNVMLINGVPPHLKWREAAMQEIHESILKEFNHDNPIDAQGRLIRKASTLDYTETFQLLSQIYKVHCYSRRIVLAPTGSKMQTVACALLKICCKDVHIEYPCPNSYYVQDYSSSDILDVYHISFDNFQLLFEGLGEFYKLNG